MATALWRLDRFDAVAFLPCDMPLIPAEWPRRMLALFEASGTRPMLTLTPGGRLQPLVSVVGRGSREALAAAVERGHLAAGRLLDDLDAAPLRGLSPRHCLNVNAPAAREQRDLQACC
jgi:molybdopterin-guanine dinucleotide biosynthesis protein A